MLSFSFWLELHEKLNHTMDPCHYFILSAKRRLKDWSMTMYQKTKLRVLKAAFFITAKNSYKLFLF
jgi:hypothetical protein